MLILCTGPKGVPTPTDPASRAQVGLIAWTSMHESGRNAAPLRAKVYFKEEKHKNMNQTQ